MPERIYLRSVGIIALIFIVSMTIPFASIPIGAVLLRHARWKEILLASSLGSATGGNCRLVLARKSGWVDTNAMEVVVEEGDRFV